MSDKADKCDQHSGCMAEIGNLKQSDKEQWEAIKKIQNRPPVWATAVISLLTFVCGCCLTYASLISKLKEMAK